MIKPPKTTLAVIAGIASSSIVLIAQTVLIQDDFDLAGSRTPESRLNGTAPEGGSLKDTVTWNATANGNRIVFSDAGTIVITNAVEGSEARIAIEMPEPLKQLITVCAKMVIASSEWAGIGFTPDATTGTFGNQDSLYLLLRRDGQIQVFQGPDQISGLNIKWSELEPTLGPFDPKSAYTLILEFNPSTAPIKSL